MVVSYAKRPSWSGVDNRRRNVTLHRAYLFDGNWGRWGYVLLNDGELVEAYPEHWLYPKGGFEVVDVLTPYENAAFPPDDPETVRRFTESYEQFLYQQGRLIVEQKYILHDYTPIRADVSSFNEHIHPL